jgi:N-methylhydantoinase A
VERGIDPRRYALLAFGGAGPLHATQIADELGIDTILCPRAAGVLAALGLVVSPRRRDVQRSVLWSGGSLTGDAIAAVVEELADRAKQALDEKQADVSVSYELRYRGQSFELAVPGATDASPEQLREAFETVHEVRYGYRDQDQALELVTIRVTATSAGADVILAGSGESTSEHWTSRRAVLDGEELEVEVVAGRPAPGTVIAGPAVVELPESTVLVTEGWQAEVDPTGTLRLTRAR